MMTWLPMLRMSVVQDEGAELRTGKGECDDGDGESNACDGDKGCGDC